VSLNQGLTDLVAVALVAALAPLVVAVLTGVGWSGTGCLNAVAWLLRQPEDAVTVQELVDLYAAPAGS
jgi:hypothetical protein